MIIYQKPAGLRTWGAWTFVLVTKVFDESNKVLSMKEAFILLTVPVADIY